MIYVLLHVDIYDSSCFFARFWLHSNNAQLKVNTVDVCLKQVCFDNSNVLSTSLFCMAACSKSCHKVTVSLSFWGRGE